MDLAEDMVAIEEGKCVAARRNVNAIAAVKKLIAVAMDTAEDMVVD